MKCLIGKVAVVIIICIFCNRVINEILLYSMNDTSSLFLFFSGDIWSMYIR